MSFNVYILLDRSGSMVNKWNETIETINGYVGNLASDMNVRFAVFDSEGYDTIRNTKAGDWKKVSADEVGPRGGTPLLDAATRMMYTILDENPDKSVFVVLTDGQENASTGANKTHVSSLIQKLVSIRCETVFLGANFDQIGDQAKSFGLNATTRGLNMAPGTMVGYGTDFLSAKTVAYAAVGASSATMDFNDADRNATKAKK